MSEIHVLFVFQTFDFPRKYAVTVYRVTSCSCRYFCAHVIHSREETRTQGHRGHCGSSQHAAIRGPLRAAPFGAPCPARLCRRGTSLGSRGRSAPRRLGRRSGSPPRRPRLRLRVAARAGWQWAGTSAGSTKAGGGPARRTVQGCGGGRYGSNHLLRRKY